jgi:hypothetical protein
MNDVIVGVVTRRRPTTINTANLYGQKRKGSLVIEATLAAYANSKGRRLSNEKKYVVPTSSTLMLDAHGCKCNR